MARHRTSNPVRRELLHAVMPYDQEAKQKVFWSMVVNVTAGAFLTHLEAWPFSAYCFIQLVTWLIVIKYIGGYFETLGKMHGEVIGYHQGIRHRDMYLNAIPRARKEEE